uniref:Putative blue-light photoreceptor PCMADA2 n=1 Tax=Pilobolus crystallinus TaxID=369761 RepID=B8YIE4_9FUNG|nr:putative blue-light photoreceptor PCMADA2 [Pilobolus crystallinus]
MDPFPAYSGQFNPQLYESSNVLPSNDKVFSISGYQAGLMTNQLPAPPPRQTEEKYSGMYANTGFDMLSILARVVNRPNPQIKLGPVDLSCSFVVVDARQYDFPLVYVSPVFEKLTGYSPADVMGKNCRFLQSPDGHVAIGSRRKYTDNTTVYHIKTHMVQGKESQSSIINYRKTGQPFVNLLTVIPISWDSDEIDYFMGLQVDLVEQPNSIFQNMKDGTYTVNYRASSIPTSIPGMHDMKPVQEWTRPPSPKIRKKEVTETVMDVETLIKEASTDEGKYRRSLHELLLDESPDFIHVLTIKGIFLYGSESTKQVLEYDPNELVGKSLKAICHPSDITTVMRELKQSSNDSNEPVNLIYRVYRKNSGYMWIECSGKLRNEDGRGRKYVILSGRERSVYQLPRSVWMMGTKAHKDNMNGAEDHEFWAKLSVDGLLLYISWTCANILGSSPNEIIGTSLYQLMRSNRTTDLTRALAEVREGKIVYLRHALLNNEGLEVMVASTFYPDGKSNQLQDKPSFVLMQTKIIVHSEENTEEENVFVSMDADMKKKGRADISAETRTVKVERMVDELDITREANWQYELHQLRIGNKNLRDELATLLKRAKQAGEQQTVCATCYS